MHIPIIQNIQIIGYLYMLQQRTKNTHQDTDTRTEAAKNGSKSKMFCPQNILCHFKNMSFAYISMQTSP